MSFLTSVKALFAAPQTIEKAVVVGEKVTDGIIDGLDKIWHTEEEKTEAQQKATETLLEFWKATAHENTQQSEARRWLAKETFKVYFFFILMGATVYKVDAEFAKTLLDFAASMTWLIAMIAGIYFGPQQISKVWKKK